MRIEKADKTGFCFGVNRAINILENVARERGNIETLGAVVHNQQVLDRLAGRGVRVVNSIDDIEGNTIVTSSHGVSPQLEEELKARNIDIVSTTCPFVQRAHVASRKLSEAGFFVVVFGEADHAEVKGILGWADGNGTASLHDNFIADMQTIPHRIGILSQTTQIPAHFNEFIKKIIDGAFGQDSELRIIDTICHDIPDRQAAALKLANTVDLMLVVGGLTSANTHRLTEICSAVTETHMIQTAKDIQPSWLAGKNTVGVTSGASTAEQDVNDVLEKLKQ